MKTIHVNSNGIKSIAINESGTIISIRAFRKDITRNRLNNWTKINKEVVSYTANNLQDFGRFLIKDEPINHTK